jgi:hypothetical protein
MPITDHVDSIRDRDLPDDFLEMRQIFACMSKFEVVDFAREAIAHRKLIAEAERYGEA